MPLRRLWLPESRAWRTYSYARRSLSAGTCHSPNRSWYQQWFYCHREHFRNWYQYGGFPFSKTLMLMDWPYANQQWGAKVEKSVRVSKVGCYIKPSLVQCANAVFTNKKHPEIRNSKKRRDHKKAIIAMAKMILTALYHMLKNGGSYNAELCRKSILSPTEWENTVKLAISIARNQNYKIKSVTA